MANPFIHIELHATDVAKAKGFYGKLFDWKLSESPMQDGSSYTVIDVGKGPGSGGGIMQQPMPGAPSSWLPYVAVDDVAAMTKKAASLGGKVVKEPTEIPGVGWFSIVVDPTGAAVALFKPNMK